jgi:hypothetical protein
MVVPYFIQPTFRTLNRQNNTFLFQARARVFDTQKRERVANSSM